MDNCVIDVILEFLGVAFHNILYYSAIYPNSIFETRRKYNIVVFRSIHPEVNEYIDLCLKSISECLKSGSLKRIEFVLTTNSFESLGKFVFDFDKSSNYKSNDAYLIQAEQNMRAFCLILSTLSDKFDTLPEDRSFIINLYTNELAAVAMATNPSLEGFPLVETDEKTELNNILPMRRFCIRDYSVDTYIEMK